MYRSSEFVSSEYLHLNHCGVQYLWEKEVYHMDRPKGRADYHILYLYQGICHVQLQGTERAIEAGNLILFRPGERQRYRFYRSDHSISCYLHFSGTGCDALLSEMGFSQEPVLYIGKSRELLSLFEKAALEHSLQRPLSCHLCGAYLWEILALAGRKHRDTENETFSKYHSRIDEVCRFLYRCHALPLTVERCAKECNLSPGRFAHLFKESTGKTPLEYWTEIRISKAKELLLYYDHSISEVAEAVGFADQNYFARIFKRYTGVSPKQYAKAQQR